jgi:uncharacterized coiled-coil protein SlyX
MASDPLLDRADNAIRDSVTLINELSETLDFMRTQVARLRMRQLREEMADRRPAAQENPEANRA